MKTVLWFRRDLRLQDSPALQAAARAGLPIIPIFIFDQDSEGPWSVQGAGAWWLNKSLHELNSELEKLGSRLIICHGSALKILRALCQSESVHFTFWNRLYDPETRKRDEEIKKSLEALDIKVQSFNSSLLIEPWDLKAKTGGPYQVFTAFERASAALKFAEPLNINLKQIKWYSKIESIALEDLPLHSKSGWESKLESHWKPGSRNAQKALGQFLGGPVKNYKTSRDIPSEIGTSRLSAHLHFGEIGPRQILASLNEAINESRSKPEKENLKFYLREIIWREFSHHILYHFPSTPLEPLRNKFSRFPWKKPGAEFDAWKKGMTGYPIVDAGMRELWETGWMHNRVRMIVASFLTKHLMISWTEGAQWFWNTLVDADLANNTMGWQWSAGCGADAAPYFRIFNPTLQGEKFDPEGVYIKKWVPELKMLSSKEIHQPWKSSMKLNYPRPVVDHSFARDRALKSFQIFRKASGG